MVCRDVSEQLPWLLNGTLPAAEKQAVQEHLASCPACRAELEEVCRAAAVFGAHLPPETLLDLAWQRPPEGFDIVLVRRHLESCPACAEELALLRESRRAEAETRPAGSRRAWPIARYAGWAAALVLAFAAGLWRGASAPVEGPAGPRAPETESRRWIERLAATESEMQRLRDATADLQRQLEQRASPQLNLPVIELSPGDQRQRSAGAADELVVPAGSRVVALVLNTAVAARSASVELRDPAGRVLWKAAGLRAGPLGAYTLAVPVELLPAGRLTVHVRPDGGRPAESYVLHLRR